MSVRTYKEVVCDWCSCARGFSLDWRREAKDDGWILTRAGKHFCTPDCQQAFSNQQKENQHGTSKETRKL